MKIDLVDFIVSIVITCLFHLRCSLVSAPYSPYSALRHPRYSLVFDP